MKIPKGFEHLDMNKAFTKAIDSVFYARKNTLIIGNAGAGKSTFLNLSKAICEENSLKAVFLAPTGISALLLQGQTLHSFFKLPFSFVEPENVYLKPKVADLINKLDILFLDEVSMLQANNLEVIDSLCRRSTEVYHKPFGGKQIVLLGDLYQIPPVISRDITEQAMYRAKYGDNPYFFSSGLFKMFGDEFSKIAFTKIYRQKDSSFKDILNRIRVGEQTDEDLDIINSKVIDYETFQQNYPETIYMSPFNKAVDRINQEHLAEISTSALLIPAIISGNVNLKNHLVPKDLILKSGAKIMTLVNDKEFRYQNGSIGTFIKALSRDELLIEIRGKEVKIKRYEFKEYTYKIINDVLKKVQKGSIAQFPLKLSYSLTYHKSQGQTFQSVYIDLAKIFADHMVYLALSRAVSLESIGLKRPLKHSDITISSHVKQFMETFNYTNN